MALKVLGRMGVLVLALIVGGALGFGIAYLFENGWFWGWEPVAAPPEAVASIRQINRSEVWVEAASGALYYNAEADTCAADCWVSVDSVPEAPEVDSEVRQVIAETCVRPPPLFGSVERKAECQVEQWVDFNTVYARQRNGDLRVWRFTSGGEWVGLTYLFMMVLGAVAVFVIALVVVLTDAIVRWARRRRLSAG